ncbi:MAG: N-6 DNA methylase [Polyangiaceae bacterium]|nr:N-6 DNA methylase [Myxococcales bacterium]MCB9590208.1 N-6 DNA methylase [Polyangiaceae bacterium]MCB9608087.1 N-6 DNA methylase [Polyangiaceae bacterium]
MNTLRLGGDRLEASTSLDGWTIEQLVSSAQPTAISDGPLRGWLGCLERAAKRIGRSPEVWANWALVWLGSALAARRGLVPSPPDPDPGPLEWLDTARSVSALRGARLLAREFDAEVIAALDGKSLRKCKVALESLLDSDSSVELLGKLHERLLEWDTTGDKRRRSGSFYTPPEVCALIAKRAIERPDAPLNELPRICDPAVGGGAFLLACLRRLAPDPEDRERRLAVVARLLGVDRSARALAVAEFSLWLELGQSSLVVAELPLNLRSGDSLEIDLKPRGNVYGWAWSTLAPHGFELVIGNPPWVAFAGRAAQPLGVALRKRYMKHFLAWRGYPTLHGLFVELATKLAPRGRVALLLPSPVADLDGYRAVREVATAHHRLMLPLPELGSDAFPGVTQPSFGLLLEPDDSATACGEAWKLVERQSRASAASELSKPQVLQRLAELPTLPAACFGERGFQSAGEISRSLFHRGNAPHEGFVLGLLEGRDVQEFRLGPTRLFLKPDAQVLARCRAKLRAPEAYAEVAFVVRQTATHPIAALHDGRYFRNTLLAGFPSEGLSAELLVGLLNSALYRALHVVENRDVRQKVFPQVKIRQLRALPMPPENQELRGGIEALVKRASQSDAEALGELGQSLDASVFALFGLTSAEREEVLRFLHDVTPRALAARRSAREFAGQIAHEGEQRGEDCHHSDP